MTNIFLQWLGIVTVTWIGVIVLLVLIVNRMEKGD